jgi:hypothetical protein
VNAFDVALVMFIVKSGVSGPLGFWGIQQHTVEFVTNLGPRICLSSCANWARIPGERSVGLIGSNDKL